MTVGILVFPLHRYSLVVRIDSGDLNQVVEIFNPVHGLKLVQCS